MADASKLSNVYVMDDSLGRIKVGHAVNPHARLNTIGAGSPGRLTIAFAREMPAPLARAVERKVHRALRSSRVGKEWFAATPLEASAAIETAVRSLAGKTGMAGVGEARVEPKYSTHVRLGPGLYDRVAALAKRDDRSVADFIRIFVKRKLSQIESKAGTGDSTLHESVWS